MGAEFWNWIQECSNQDQRQSGQSTSWMQPIEESLTLVISHIYTEHVYGMESLVFQFRVTYTVHFSLYMPPLQHSSVVHEI